MSEESRQIDSEDQWQQTQRQIEEQHRAEEELQRSRDLEFQRYQEERQQETERQEQQRRAEQRQTQQRRETEERRQRQEEQREARQQKATEQKLEPVQAADNSGQEEQRDRAPSTPQPPPAQQSNPYSQTFNISASELMDERQPLRQVQEQMYREGLQDQLRSSGQKQGLDRHDYYHMEFAAELDGAMGRAKAAGVNLNKPEQVLKFIQKEEARTEGKTTDSPKRLLSDRYQEFTRRTKERDSLLRRGVPEKLVPSTQLRESHSEQQARFRQQFDQAINETQWRSEVNQRWQQKQSAKAAQSPELSPARARLEQIRAANGIDPNQQPKQSHQKER